MKCGSVSMFVNPGIVNFDLLFRCSWIPVLWISTFWFDVRGSRCCESRPLVSTFVNPGIVNFDLLFRCSWFPVLWNSTCCENPLLYHFSPIFHNWSRWIGMRPRGCHVTSTTLLLLLSSNSVSMKLGHLLS